MGSASGHVHRTLVPSHEGHIKIPLGGTLAECRHLTWPLPRAPPWRRPLHWLLLRLGLIIVPVCTPRLCLGMHCHPPIGQGSVPVLRLDSEPEDSDVEGDDTLH